MLRLFGSRGLTTQVRIVRRKLFEVHVSDGVGVEGVYRSQCATLLCAHKITINMIATGIHLRPCQTSY